jgi:hypothetical protein
LLLGASLSAHAADILASGPVFGDGQNRVVCTVFNANNNTTITFVSTQIRNQFAGDAPLNFNGCGTSLGPNRICSFQAAADPNNLDAFSCKVTINQSKANVRGTMTALFFAVPISSADLR